jgi:parallel beta-helix repeat protein
MFSRLSLELKKIQNNLRNLFLGPLLCMLALLCFLAFGISDTHAADGIQIIGNCTVIDRPGSYVLANNIRARQKDLKSVLGSEPSCILIVADFVTLDLNGYTIAGPGSGFGIYSTGPGRRATQMHDGSVTNFERGIALEGDSHKCERVRALGNNVGVSLDGGGFVVQEVHASSNGTFGIWGLGSGHSVRNNQVNQNGDSGINLSGSSRCSIIGNTVLGNGVGGGIVAQCPSVILQNMSSQNVGPDIFTDFSAACTRSDNNPAP